ncbi:MAG: alpha/beta hydrolase [Lachnospiraceae bacterium]|nr:alpha/beta hydrolase [Lachnospiraceae bacterium]
MICNVMDIPVNYEEYGEGKPILCIHGYSVDHRLMSGCLEPVFENIQGYRRIYIDLPGMGKTPSDKWIKNSDNMLEVVSGFINAVIPNENFLIAGESYGGYLTLGLLHNKRERIDGALFIAPQLKSWIINNIEKEKLPKPQLLWIADNMPTEEEDSEVKEFLNFAVIATKEIFEKNKEQVLCGIKIADNDFLYNYFDGSYNHNFEAALRIMEYEKPTCIITGRQDHAVGYLDAFEMLKRFPRATFAVMDCAGHNLQIENENIFNQMVADWIKRINCKFP